MFDGCYGARMTGAGFGGCAVALVGTDGLATFITEVSRKYTQQSGLTPRIYPCRASAGAERIGETAAHDRWEDEKAQVIQ